MEDFDFPYLHAKRKTKLGLRLTLKAFKQRGIFIVPHLL
jgi:hypothetical protein